MDICVAVAMTSALLLRLPSPITLAWEHSVGRFPIEETWEATPQGLLLVEVRTEGLAAGIDLPDGAQAVGRQWRFAPALPPQRRVLLANSEHGAGYRACAGATCRGIEARGQAISISACGPDPM